MSWAEKTRQGIEDWFTKKPEPDKPTWGDRISGWMVSWFARGATKTLEDFEPDAIDSVKNILLKVKDDPNTPDELKAMIDKVLTPGNPIVVVLGVLLVVAMFTGTLGALFAPLNRATEYKADRVVESFRMDPMSIITAWRRDPEKYAWLFDDLEEQGWSDQKIEALKFFTLFYPAPADLVRWQAREVFEPEMVKRYGLDDEFEAIEKEPFYKAGMTDEQILNYWRAHWEHASWIQVVEMVRRGQITEPDVWDWFRLVEIPPFWRQKLINTSWEVPTRVDVRRFWDMRTIDEARLREIYTAQGYHGKDLEDYVLWTKIYVDFPDLMTRYKNGWLTLDNVRAELVKLGMSAERAEELIQTKVKAVASEKLVKDKDLTAAEIVKGVKKEVITWAQGIELLMDLGYDEWEAEFKLAIDVAVEAGSPETFAEFKDITSKWRRGLAMETKGMPEDIKKAAAEVVRVTGEVKALERSLEEEERLLIAEELLPAEATARKRKLQASLRKAEAELSRVRTEYERLVAEWKHGLP